MYNWVKPDNVAVGSHMGNDANSYRKIRPNVGENAKTGNVLWNYSFPDGLVESVPKLRETIVFKVAGTTKAALKSKIGLAYFAINKMITSLNVEINGKKFSSNPAQTVDIITHAGDPNENALLSQLSQPNDYREFNTELLNDPLIIGGDAVNSINSRGLGCRYKVVDISTADGDTTVKVEVEEAIIASPFQYQKPLSAQPFHNVNSFIMNMNIDANPNVLFNKNSSIAGAITLESIHHELLIRTWNPNVKANIPKSLVYNAPLIERKQVKTVTLGALKTKINLDSFVLNGVPSMFALVVKRPFVPNKAQSYQPITKISISTDNRQNLLSNLDAYQLYLLSSKNGLNLRPAAFLGYQADPTSATDNPGIGSIMYFRPSDLGLNSDTVANVNKTMNFNMEIEVKSEDVETKFNVELYTFSDNFVYDTDGTFTEVRPLLTSEELLKSPTQYSVQDDSMKRVLGGGKVGGNLMNVLSGMMDFLKSPLGKSAVKLGRNNIPYLRDVARDGTMLGNVASHFGYGNKGGDLVKLAGSKGKKSGTKSKAKGGKVASKAQLLKSLKL
ncbi:major capsid protein V20 domain-containing protein [Winogradskyella sp.]